MEPSVFVPWKSLMEMRLHYWREIDRTNLQFFLHFFVFLGPSEAASDGVQSKDPSAIFKKPFPEPLQASAS
jgi:hypothetical protein